MEFFSELLIFNVFIVSESKHNGEVVRSFFINNMDVLDGIQKWLVILSNILLNQRRTIQDFSPISFNPTSL